MEFRFKIVDMLSKTIEKDVVLSFMGGKTGAKTLNGYFRYVNIDKTKKLLIYTNRKDCFGDEIYTDDLVMVDGKEKDVRRVVFSDGCFWIRDEKKVAQPLFSFKSDRLKRLKSYYED